MGCCAQVVADMVEVQQIAALTAKALLDLMGNPRGAITDTVGTVAFSAPLDFLGVFLGRGAG